MSSTAAEFFKWVGQAIVVGLGWLVVHHLSVKRDRENSRREMLAASADGLAEALGALLAEGREYHLRGRSVSTELRIKMTLQDLAMRVSGLSDLCQETAHLASCRSDIGAVRRAITGRHFEDEHIVQLHEADTQLESIADAVIRAKRSCLRLKHNQFLPQVNA